MNDLLSRSHLQIIWLNSFMRTLLREALLGHMYKGHWETLGTASLLRGFGKLVPSGLLRIQDALGLSSSQC